MAELCATQTSILSLAHYVFYADFLNYSEPLDYRCAKCYVSIWPLQAVITQIAIK